jgi:hypothetical protein
VCSFSDASKVCRLRTAVSHVFCMHRRQAWSLKLVHMRSTRTAVSCGYWCSIALAAGMYARVFLGGTHCTAMKAQLTAIHQYSSRLGRSVTAGCTM